MKLTSLYSEPTFRDVFDAARDELDWPRTLKLLDDGDAVALEKYLGDHFRLFRDELESEIESNRGRRTHDDMELAAYNSRNRPDL